METGRTVILLNLESLYESLYDALNQVWMREENLLSINFSRQSTAHSSDVGESLVANCTFCTEASAKKSCLVYMFSKWIIRYP